MFKKPRKQRVKRCNQFKLRKPSGKREHHVLSLPDLTVSHHHHRLYLFWPVSWSVKGAKHGRGEVVRARVSTPFAENENSQFAYNLFYNNDGTNNGDFD